MDRHQKIYAVPSVNALTIELSAAPPLVGASQAAFALRPVSQRRRSKRWRCTVRPFGPCCRRRPRFRTQTEGWGHRTKLGTIFGAESFLQRRPCVSFRPYGLGRRLIDGSVSRLLSNTQHYRFRHPLLGRPSQRSSPRKPRSENPPEKIVEVATRECDDGDTRVRRIPSGGRF